MSDKKLTSKEMWKKKDQSSEGKPEENLEPSDQSNPIPSELPTRILWVGNIGPDVTEEILEKEFNVFGKVTSIRILHNKYCAFVNFEKEEEAQKAKKNLQNTLIGNQYITINYRKPNQRPLSASPTLPYYDPSLPPTFPFFPPNPLMNFETDFQNPNLNFKEPARALWIGNIADSVEQKELIKEFEKFGKIESVRILRPKTCAFVNFYKTEDAVKALNALQGKKMGNLPIKINFGKIPSEPKPPILYPQPYMVPENYMPTYPPVFFPYPFFPSFQNSPNNSPNFSHSSEDLSQTFQNLSLENATTTSHFINNSNNNLNNSNSQKSK